MKNPDTINHCGIDYFDPVAVGFYQKEYYWHITGKIMQALGTRCSRSDPEKIAFIFKNLPIVEQEKILLLQRKMSIMQVNNWKRQDYSYTTPRENYLSWRFIKQQMNRLQKSEPVLTDYKKTSLAYTAPSITDIFGRENRIYIPLKQFAHSYDINGNMMMALSRHPYDLFRMSTKRKWKNCMSFDRENFEKYIPHDIKNGTIVAYGVFMSKRKPYMNDWNIADPSLRCLIKPYTNQNGTFIYKRDRIFSNYNQHNLPFKTAANEVTRQWLCRDGIPDTDYDLGKLYTEEAVHGITFKKNYMSDYPVKPFVPGN